MSRKFAPVNANLRVFVDEEGAIYVRNQGGGHVKWASPRHDVHPGDLRMDRAACTERALDDGETDA